MRWFASLVTVLFLAVSPASAGSSADAEVTDPCGDVSKHAGVEPVAPWEDICKVWFDTASTTGGVTVTLELAALQPRTPTFHSVAWQSGGCQLQAVSQDASGPTLNAARELLIQCGVTQQPCELPPVGGCTTYDETVRVPLDGSVAEGTDTIRFTVARSRVPADKRHLFEPGVELSKPLALTGPVVAGQTFLVWGPCEDFRCDSKIGDWSPAGRTFVIGS